MSTTTVYPVTSRHIQLDKIQCDWCYGTPAAWKIVDEFAWTNYACTVHGTEWFPFLFPESDTTPIERIVSEINSRVSLAKHHDQELVAAQADWHLVKRHAQNARPWYPLVGHRDGLRSNDLIALASALWVECNERGAVYDRPGDWTGEWTVAERHPHS